DALARGDKETAIALLVKIADTEGLESRHYLQAWHFLRSLGVLPPRAEEKKLHGVVIELAWNGGLDLIVAYSDLKARYYNYSGAGVVWEHPDDSLDAVIHELLDVGWAVAVKLAPWTGVRPAIPPQGHFRINLLTPGGLRFGQGPTDALSSDPLAQPVFAAGQILMRELIKKVPRGKE
ncbi:MAG: hypothetical protein ACHP79_16485, partial [Terriglobales bacterium]